MSLLGSILLLTLAYLALTADLTPGNLLLGLAIASAIMVLLHPRRRNMKWRALPGSALALARYIVILIYDLIASGIQVTRIVFDPALPIKPGIVAVPSGCRSDLETALSMHAVTLTPGELVVEVDAEGVMYTHCLDASRSAEVQMDAQRLRQNLLRKIFP